MSAIDRALGDDENLSIYAVAHGLNNPRSAPNNDDEVSGRRNRIRLIMARTARAVAEPNHLEALGRLTKQAQRSRQSKVSDVTRDEIDARLEAVEARTETRFVELSAKIDKLSSDVAANINHLIGTISSMNEKLQSVDTDIKEVRTENKTTRTTVVITGITSVLALAALFVAFATYGDAIFSRGMQVRDVVNSAIIEVDKQRAAQPPQLPAPKSP